MYNVCVKSAYKKLYVFGFRVYILVLSTFLLSTFWYCRHFGTVDILIVDILDIDILGVDILIVNILVLRPRRLAYLLVQTIQI